MLSNQSLRRFITILQHEAREMDIAIASLSMSPVIAVNTKVTLRGSVSSPRQGDIVLVSSDRGADYLHRIIELGRDHVITKGDHNPHPDPPCSIDDIVGICVAINGHRIDTPTWRFVNRQIARISPYSHQLRAPIRVLGRIRRALGLWWL